MFSVAIKVALFVDVVLKNIQLICLIYVKLLIKIKRNSMDTLSKLLTFFCYILGEAAVDELFYSRFTFKLSFFLRFSTWKGLVS